jgi:uncharacterized membrane protein
MSPCEAGSAPANVEVASVGIDRPLVWLYRGWQDLWRAPVISLAYGAVVAAGGGMILITTAWLPYLFAAAVSGFVLIAPVLATGLYEVSRRHAEGKTAGFDTFVASWRRNPSGMAAFALFLLLAGTAWQVISVVMVALFYQGEAMSPLSLILAVVREDRYLPLFITYLVIGGSLAALVFAASVVSVPMLVDRDCDLFEAITTSLRAVGQNPAPLAVWAALIMILSGLGFATLMLGFVIIMPWLGHASWHVYRDLVP